jgi:SAM-dependent methyltransferase
MRLPPIVRRLVGCCRAVCNLIDPLPPESEIGTEDVRQRVRFLIAENARINQLLLEIIYLNNLKRSFIGSQTKSSFNYQWGNVKEGKWMPSNKEFLSETPKHIMEWTKLPRDWFAGKRVLDAGCGSGRWTYGFIKLGAHVTAVDQSENALNETRELVGQTDQLECRRMDLIEGGFQIDSFDLVWSFGVAHHTENPIRVMKHLISAVKPDGYLFMMLYAFPRITDHFREQALYAEWRQRFMPLEFEDRVRVLRENYPEDLVHGYFDAFSPLINDLFVFDWIKAFLQAEGFDSIQRTNDAPNHYFVAHRKPIAC